MIPRSSTGIYSGRSSLRSADKTKRRIQWLTFDVSPCTWPSFYRQLNVLYNCLGNIYGVRACIRAIVIYTNLRLRLSRLYYKTMFLSHWKCWHSIWNFDAYIFVAVSIILWFLSCWMSLSFSIYSSARRNFLSCNWRKEKLHLLEKKNLN